DQLSLNIAKAKQMNGRHYLYEPGTTPLRQREVLPPPEHWQRVTVHEKGVMGGDAG
ncbi:hypothetical protein SARC_16133, partial [Sphaeroforma arctica JP610]